MICERYLGTLTENKIPTQKVETFSKNDDDGIGGKGGRGFPLPPSFSSLVRSWYYTRELIFKYILSCRRRLYFKYISIYFIGRALPHGIYICSSFLYQ